MATFEVTWVETVERTAVIDANDESEIKLIVETGQRGLVKDKSRKVKVNKVKKLTG